MYASTRELNTILNQKSIQEPYCTSLPFDGDQKLGQTNSNNHLIIRLGVNLQAFVL